MCDLKAPFPWFGGKSAVAPLVWQRFGDVPNYSEPFFGSGAILLARPTPFDGVETVNDQDGFVSNFWRAVKHDPAGVAYHADWPQCENDLHARHMWLVHRASELVPLLEGDPDYYDVQAAGWWAWGMSLWIGGEFCSGKGPWQWVEGDDGRRRLLRLGGEEQGVERKRIHLSNGGIGVNRRLVHLSDAGRGVNRKLVHLSDADNGLLEWMESLAQRLRRVRVCSGDWTRVCGGKSGNALASLFAGGDRCAVFFDPPYPDDAGRDCGIYREECLQVGHAAQEWAIARGNDKRLRIALCGYDSLKMPEGWKCERWKTKGGYANQSARDTPGKANCRREVIWFSPHCVNPTPGLFE